MATTLCCRWSPVDVDLLVDVVSRLDNLIIVGIGHSWTVQGQRESV